MLFLLLVSGLVALVVFGLGLSPFDYRSETAFLELWSAVLVALGVLWAGANLVRVWVLSRRDRRARGRS